MTETSKLTAMGLGVCVYIYSSDNSTVHQKTKAKVKYRKKKQTKKMIAKVESTLGDYKQSREGWNGYPIGYTEHSIAAGPLFTTLRLLFLADENVSLPLTSKAQLSLKLSSSKTSNSQLYPPSEEISVREPGLHFFDLPREIHNIIFKHLLEDATFNYVPFLGRKSLLPYANIKAPRPAVLSTVSRGYVTYQQTEKILIRNSKISVLNWDDILKVSRKMSAVQGRFAKTLSVGDCFCPLTTKNYMHVSEALVSVPSTYSWKFPMFLSISKESSIARALLERGEETVRVSYQDDVAKGYISSVEAEDLALAYRTTDSSPVMYWYYGFRKIYNPFSVLLRWAAERNITLQKQVRLVLVERGIPTVLSVVQNATFSTKDWCLEVPLPGGQMLSIEQKLARECYQAKKGHVKQLLGVDMPSTHEVSVDIKGLDGDSGLDTHHWMCQYGI
ncbi:hypothetical protein LTS08_003503 [Lithohypha guttulata]|nr:hypothetical protein LTS08_003503 [Lithohypha guttulata]